METDNQKELQDPAGQAILDAISKWHEGRPETRSAMLILSDTAELNTEQGISGALIGSARDLSTAIVLSLNAQSGVGDVIEKAYIAFYLQHSSENENSEDENENGNE